MAINLRAIEESDLSQLRGWRNSSQLRSFVREYRLLNMINQRDWLDHISRSREVEMFGIELETMSRDAIHQVVPKISTWGLIGVCGLCNINWVNRTAEVSLYIARRDEGIYPQALEALRQKAFDELNLHRLWAEVYEHNHAMVLLFGKCGYSLEGVMRKHVFKQGEYHNSLIYGLLKGEK